MGLFDKFRLLYGSKPEEAPPAPADRRLRERRNARAGTQALIIDDSKTIVVALRRILHSADFKVLEALDAEAGLELAAAHPVEIIFLDIVLPGMNGFSALRHLRRNPATKDIPVIMMSGNEQATEQFFGSRIGADDFMKKPFSRLEVFARIERLLDDELVPRRHIRDIHLPAPAAG